ncbi:MAG: HPF/RaiA family ribosome-associated protein [Rhodobacter sp.]|nr:HPF/RaiA family ribosome-associated protein [Rhodobacter sp.]
MQTDPQIVFRGLDTSQALTDVIHGKIAVLERSFDHITSCRVTVEKSDRHGRKGHHFHVAVEMEVPGTVIVVNRKPGDIGAHEDVNIAIRDSFKAARRQLDDYARKIQGVHVKAHPEKHHGRIVRLFPEEGYGFLKTPGGLEVYFQRDSLIGDGWDRLDLETELEFSLMDGEKGPYAVNLSPRG